MGLQLGLKVVLSYYWRPSLMGSHYFEVSQPHNEFYCSSRLVPLLGECSESSCLGHHLAKRFRSNANIEMMSS